MGGWSITKVTFPQRIVLKPTKEHSVNLHHPWIFSGAIQSPDDFIPPGEIVDVYSSKGEWLARGAFNPYSQIRVRILSWDENIRIDENFFRNKLKSVIEEKYNLFNREKVNAYRLVYAESDGLPGLIVDQYDKVLVVQFLSWACEKWRSVIIDTLAEQLNPFSILERSDSDMRSLEGLDERVGIIWGDNIENPVLIHENDLSYWVDIYHGHKTGFYLDQRENRLRVKQYARHRQILDGFCYSGGMTLPCLSGGAKAVECIDSSAAALSMLQKNVQLNKFDPSSVTIVEGDVFTELRKRRDQGRVYDMVILDPPKLAPTVSFIHKASRAYKDINLIALKLLDRGGILATFSCSGGISLELFQKIIFGAALDANREVKILEVLHQASDHGVALNFPESAYLKGFILYVK